jgi:FdhD protein
MTTRSHEGRSAAVVQERHLPARSVALTQVTEWAEGAVRPVEDFLAAEEPLEIRVGGKPLTVTMRTPGNDCELAAGLLFTEGLLERREQLREIREVDRNVVEMELETGALGEFDKLPERNFVASAACGVCGKASIEAVHRSDLKPPDSAFTIDPELLCALPERLRSEQQVFGRTGGLHAAALFDMSADEGGTLVALREDIGRHNAVDKVVGWALLEGRLPLSNHVLLVSGRGGFEIVQKALAAGVPVLASVSAPSSLAVRLAREFNLTLAGFLRGRRFVVYSGAARCIPGAR